MSKSSEEYTEVDLLHKHFVGMAENYDALSRNPDLYKSFSNQKGEHFNAFQYFYRIQNPTGLENVTKAYVLHKTRVTTISAYMCLGLLGAAPKDEISAYLFKEIGLSKAQAIERLKQEVHQLGLKIDDEAGYEFVKDGTLSDVQILSKVRQILRQIDPESYLLDNSIAFIIENKAALSFHNSQNQRSKRVQTLDERIIRVFSNEQVEHTQQTVQFYLNNFGVIKTASDCVKIGNLAGLKNLFPQNAYSKDEMNRILSFDLFFYNRNNLFHFAVMTNQASIVEFFINISIDHINYVNAEGFSALDLQLVKPENERDPRIIAMLLENGAVTKRVKVEYAPSYVEDVRRKLVKYASEIKTDNAVDSARTVVKFIGRNATLSAGLGITMAVLNPTSIFLKSLTWLPTIAVGSAAIIAKKTSLEKSPFDVVDEVGRTPLHYAAASGQINALVELIRYGLNLNHQDRNGNTPIHLACARGQWKAVRVLINHGANLYLANNEPMPLVRNKSRGRCKRPVDKIFETGELENIIDFLLLARKDIKNWHEQPENFYDYIAQTYQEMTSYIIYLDDNQIKLKDLDGRNLLHYAADISGPKLYEIWENLDHNKDRYTLKIVHEIFEELSEAIYEINSTKAFDVKKFVSLKERLDKVYYDGSSAETKAKFAKLIEGKSGIKTPVNQLYESFRNYVRSLNKKFSERLDDLYEQRAIVYSKLADPKMHLSVIEGDASNVNPLHLAAVCGNYHILKNLDMNNVNRQDSTGKTVLHHLVINAFSAKDVSEDARIALDDAYYRCLREILRAKINLETKDKSGNDVFDLLRMVKSRNVEDGSVEVKSNLLSEFVRLIENYRQGKEEGCFVEDAELEVNIQKSSDGSMRLSSKPPACLVGGADMPSVIISEEAEQRIAEESGVLPISAFVGKPVATTGLSGNGSIMFGEPPQ